MVNTRSMQENQIDTATDIKSDPDARSRSDKSMCGTSIASFTGSTLGRMLGCISVYALFLTSGNDRLVQGKFLGSHIVSMGVGAGGCWAVAFLIFPSSLATCIGAGEEEMFKGYKVWAQNREDSPSNPTRKKRFILSEPVLPTKTTEMTTKSQHERKKTSTTQATSPVLPTSSPALSASSPASSTSSPASLASTRDPSAPKHRYTDQPTEADESIAPTAGTDPPNNGLTPPSPYDAQMQEKKLDLDSFLDSTLRIPMATIYKVATASMLLLIVVNVCGLLGLFCHLQRTRTSAPTRPPTFPTMNERTSNGPDQVTTWEDALSNRGLGGLGRLETPTPPPFPAHKDSLDV